MKINATKWNEKNVMNLANFLQCPIHISWIGYFVSPLSIIYMCITRYYLLLLVRWILGEPFLYCYTRVEICIHMLQIFKQTQNIIKILNGNKYFSYKMFTYLEND